jgi:hypothetical protein
LREEFADEALFFFVFDAREKLRAQPGDCLSFVEGHLVVNLSARKMAGLTAGLKDRFDLFTKVRLLWSIGQRREGEGLYAAAEGRGFSALAASRPKARKSTSITNTIRMMSMLHQNGGGYDKRKRAVAM